MVSNVYYRESLAALQQLMGDPAHLLAKASHAKWLDSYRVVIAEVRREYGLKGLGMVSLAGGAGAPSPVRAVGLAQ